MAISFRGRPVRAAGRKKIDGDSGTTRQVGSALPADWMPPEGERIIAQSRRAWRLRVRCSSGHPRAAADSRRAAGGRGRAHRLQAGLAAARRRARVLAYRSAPAVDQQPHPRTRTSCFMRMARSSSPGSPIDLRSITRTTPERNGRRLCVTTVSTATQTCSRTIRTFQQMVSVDAPFQPSCTTARPAGSRRIHGRDAGDDDSRRGRLVGDRAGARVHSRLLVSIARARQPMNGSRGDRHLARRRGRRPRLSRRSTARPAIACRLPRTAAA